MAGDNTNPWCECGHSTRDHTDREGACLGKNFDNAAGKAKHCECEAFHNKQNPLPPTRPESNLVKHARAELARLDNDPEFNESVIRMLKEFSSQGHSGGSAPQAILIITRLLEQKPLTKLTNNPAEWQHHDAEVWGQEGGIWQNKRDSRAFSTNYGMTYWMVDDPQRTVHEALSTPEGELALAKRYKLRRMARDSREESPIKYPEGTEI